MKLKRLISYLFLLIVLLLGLSFAAMNADPVTVNYYLGTTLIPLSLLLVYALGIGIALGFVTAILPLFKLKHENRLLRNTVKRFEKESALQSPSSTPHPDPL